MKSYWRNTARPIIAKVLAEHQGRDEKEIRKALTDAYPFGQRSLHPYKIWLDEVKVQLRKKGFGKIKLNPNQKELFK